MSKKIGVIGEKHSVLPFRLFGFSIYFDLGVSETRKKIEEMAQGGYGVIFVTETTAGKVKKTIDKYRSALLPAIIVFPGHLGNLGIGLERIQKDMEKAVGQNIL